MTVTTMDGASTCFRPGRLSFMFSENCGRAVDRGGQGDNKFCDCFNAMIRLIAP